MSIEPCGRPPGASAPVRDGLLSGVLRRDLTDLNAMYLELAADPELAGDPRFGWSDAVRAALRETDTVVLATIAATPFTLFDFVSPVAAGHTPAPCVQDGSRDSLPAAIEAAVVSFVHGALSLARRLVLDEPVASRVVLAMSDEFRGWLAECRLPELAALAAAPRSIRPRWRAHVRFWDMLIGAARRGTPAALQWAHCAGLCLIDAAEQPVPSERRRHR